MHIQVQTIQREKEQEDIFRATLGINRQDGLKNLQALCRLVLNHEYDENYGMMSEHLVLLSALACSKEFRICKILEIGTFDGKTSCLLGAMFPTASILTIDLPPDDKGFLETYQREDGAHHFISKRNEMVNKYPNINFEEKNSACLVNSPADDFDLVWIDGAHGYPVVAFDIINSFRIVKHGGLVLVDDVWIERKINDHIYSSVGAYESLTQLVKANLIKSFSLIYKRIGGEYNTIENKKFVAFFQKNSGR